MVMKEFCSAVLLLLILTVPLTAVPEKELIVSQEEAVLFSAIIDESFENGLVERPLVSDRTSTLDCTNTCNGVKIGDCGSGMRSADTPVPTLLKQLKTQLPGLTQQMAETFAARNRSCARLDQLPAG